MSLTYVVLTLNEAPDIAACIRSLGTAEEMLLLDSLSTDQTIAMATTAARGMPFALRVVQRPFRDYADQRNAALDLTKTKWVFFVDADERSSPELTQEVQERIASSNAPAGYWVPRQNIIFGHRMRYTGWWPDYQLRLFQRERGRYDLSRPVHELVHLDGEPGHLRTPLTHINYRSVSEFIGKQRLYGHHEARRLAAAGDSVRPRALLTLPLREFHWRYVTLSGWRDGGHGLLLSALMAWYRVTVSWQVRQLSGQTDRRLA